MALCCSLASSSTSQARRFGLLVMNCNCLITFPLLLSECNNTLTVSSIPEIFFSHLVCFIDKALLEFSFDLLIQV